MYFHKFPVLVFVLEQTILAVRMEHSVYVSSLIQITKIAKNHSLVLAILPTETLFISLLRPAPILLFPNQTHNFIITIIFCFIALVHRCS